MAYDSNNPAAGLGFAGQNVMKAALKRNGIDLDNEEGLDQFNEVLRTSPAYRTFLTNNLGVRGELFGKNFELTGKQRKREEGWIRANMTFPRKRRQIGVEQNRLGVGRSRDARRVGMKRDPQRCQEALAARTIA